MRCVRKTKLLKVTIDIALTEKSKLNADGVQAFLSLAQWKRRDNPLWSGSSQDPVWRLKGMLVSIGSCFITIFEATVVIVVSVLGTAVFSIAESAVGVRHVFIFVHGIILG